MSDIIFSVMFCALPLRPNLNKTSACGSYTSRDSYLKTILPKSLPRYERLLTAPSLFTDGVNTDFEWDVLEMSLPLAHLLSPSSPSFFPPAFSLHSPFMCSDFFLFFHSATITFLSLHLPLAMCEFLSRGEGHQESSL